MWPVEGSRTRLATRPRRRNLAQTRQRAERRTGLGYRFREVLMRLRRALIGGTVILVVLGFTVATVSAQSNEAWLGTWTLSHAKSTLAGIMGDLPKSYTIKVERLADGSTKVTEDGYGPRG